MLQQNSSNSKASRLEDKCIAPLTCVVGPFSLCLHTPCCCIVQLMLTPWPLPAQAYWCLPACHACMLHTEGCIGPSLFFIIHYVADVGKSLLFLSASAARLEGGGAPSAAQPPPRWVPRQ